MTEPLEPAHERHSRIRRVKSLLKFMPRRAVFHKYPLIGRFAAWARRRAYFWSLKPEAVRPALYAGSILSLLPVMGVQLPLALLLSVVLRANFMVLGGLQFLTNPLTAAPIYYATHQLGVQVVKKLGVGQAPPALTQMEAMLPVPDFPEVTRLDPPGPAKNGKAPSRLAAGARRFGNAINALIIGGVLCGCALGLVLDILYRNYWQHYTHKHPPRPSPKNNSPPA